MPQASRTGSAGAAGAGRHGGARGVAGSGGAGGAARTRCGWGWIGANPATRGDGQSRQRRDRGRRPGGAGAGGFGSWVPRNDGGWWCWWSGPAMVVLVVRVLTVRPGLTVQLPGSMAGGQRGRRRGGRNRWRWRQLAVVRPVSPGQWDRRRRRCWRRAGSGGAGGAGKADGAAGADGNEPANWVATASWRQRWDWRGGRYRWCWAIWRWFDWCRRGQWDRRRWWCRWRGGCGGAGGAGQNGGWVQLPGIRVVCWKRRRRGGAVLAERGVPRVV